MQTVYAYCLGHGYLSRFTRLINVSKSDETVAKLLDPTFNGTVFLPVDRVRGTAGGGGVGLLLMKPWLTHLGT
jgi:hypothetical protein